MKNNRRCQSSRTKEQLVKQQPLQPSQDNSFWGQSTLIQYEDRKRDKSVYELDKVPLAKGQDIEDLVNFISTRRHLVVLTGAGVSTESNIPDYRGPQGAYKTGFKPMTHQTFVTNEQARKRYWARSFAGWYEFSEKKYNGSHEGLARLERNAWVKQLITQNVDSLHIMAGSKGVVELHGTLHRVKCLSCNKEVDRNDFQRRLQDLNPETYQQARRYYIQQQEEKLQIKSDMVQETSKIASNKDQKDLYNAQQHIKQDQQKPCLESIRPIEEQQGIAQLQKQQISNINKVQPIDNYVDIQQKQQKLEQVKEQSTQQFSQEHIKSKQQQQQLQQKQQLLQQQQQQQPQLQQKEKLQRSESGPFQIPIRRPDGDVELVDAGENFNLCNCQFCGGIMKPDVVYFGDNVPKIRAEQAMNSVLESDGLLIAGSSLQVWSAYRLALRASQLNIPIAIINYGDSRADDLATIKVEALVGGTLMQLAQHPILQAPCTL